MDLRVTSFYEKLFPVKQDNKKCFVWPTVILLFLLLIVLWLSKRTDWLSENGPLYLKAAPVLCTVVFWPFIIIDISHRFYKTFQAISILVLRTDTKNQPKVGKLLLDWYKKNAKDSFTFCRTNKSKKDWHYIGIMVNIWIITCIGCLFIDKDLPKNEPAFLFAFIVVSAILCIYMLEQRNLSITLFTVCCGLAYYIYLFYYSSDPLQPMFKIDCLNTISLIIIVIVFFIAGSAIGPMIGALIAFYNDLPILLNSLKIELAVLTQGINYLKTIRQYFAHLAIISLVAYFQLFSIVYIMGIFAKSELTIVLFILGSSFPLMMYCASDIMYKRLMHGQYLQFIKTIHLDKTISTAYAAKDMGAVQQLITLKEKLSIEFEERPNIQLIIALVSPIITTIAAIILDSN